MLTLLAIRWQSVAPLAITNTGPGVRKSFGSINGDLDADTRVNGYYRIRTGTPHSGYLDG